jgi:hypothetical protein
MEYLMPPFEEVLFGKWFYFWCTKEIVSLGFPAGCPGLIPGFIYIYICMYIPLFSGGLPRVNTRIF